MTDAATDARLAQLEARLASLETENWSLLRVKDALEIQNVFSMHEYYHAVGRHSDEVDAIWATKTPGLAMEEAVLNGRYVGLEAVRAYYVDWFDKEFFGVMRRAMREMYPDVDPGPDTGPPFGVRILHTLTTPVIEVAEDRQTAKAVWISPGYIAAPMGGKLQGLWHWDRYAIDFAREEDGWKIWHLWVGKDFSTPVRAQLGGRLLRRAEHRPAEDPRVPGAERAERDDIRGIQPVHPGAVHAGAARALPDVQRDVQLLEAAARWSTRP